jgi:hypothetical protein
MSLGLRDDGGEKSLDNPLLPNPIQLLNGGRFPMSVVVSKLGVSADVL